MDITPELALKAYAFGVFPMARSRDDASVVWVQPKLRGVIPLDAFHASRSLRKVLRSGEFRISCDTAFREVMEGCAEPGPGRPETWINDTISRLFTDLHQAGLAHSIEVWRDTELVGGLYGLAMGAAFFGESMFSRADNASKVALSHLVGILRRGNFVLLDTQFITDHLRQFGAIEMLQRDYLSLLSDALARRGNFQGPLEPAALLAELSQAKTQTS